MDLNNLKQHYQELIDYMFENDYSKFHVDNLSKAIQLILNFKDIENVNSYPSLIQEVESNMSLSKHELYLFKCSVGIIERFDLLHEYPSGKWRSFSKNSAYSKLNEYFKKIVDYKKNSDLERNLTESTVYRDITDGSNFLLYLQNKGINKLEDINEEDVVSFFISKDGKVTKHSTYRETVQSLFRNYMNFEYKESKRILNFIPTISRSDKNIEYLKENEIDSIKNSISSNKMTLRDVAIINLFLYYGLRRSDIANLLFSSIDWKNNRITIIQKKTKQPLSLPLFPIVGNSIYDYVAKERHNKTKTDRIFLKSYAPYNPLSANAISGVVKKCLKLSNIRQGKNQQRGTHTFRHRAATHLLENNVPKVIVTSVLGHTSPRSSETYLHSDFIHLKECAISIEDYPVDKKVFEL